MSRPQPGLMIPATLEILRQWGADLSSLLDEVFCFGSLIYQDGAQFDFSKSDVDLLAILREEANTPLARRDAVMALRPKKAELEGRLIQYFEREDNNKIVASLIPITRLECAWAIHKEGKSDLLRTPSFRSLKQEKNDVVEFGAQFNLAARSAQAAAFKVLEMCQAYRHQVVHVTIFKKGGAVSWDEENKVLPKPLLRLLAQIRALENNVQGDEAQDLNRGLEFIDRLLDPWDDQDVAYRTLHEKLTVRRNGRGIAQPLNSEDLLLLYEILFHRAMEWIKTHPTAAMPSSDRVELLLVPQLDISPWLHSLLEDTGTLPIRGIGSGAGRSQVAMRYEIERLYTPLSSRGGLDKRSQGIERAEFILLATLLARSNRLLIEGQPGAGKTTFLKLVAAMLARDNLGNSCPYSASWREKFLGMDSSEKLRMPLFLRLSQLALLLAKDPELHPANDRRRLLHLLATTSNAGSDQAWNDYWSGLLERGEVMLLLDGLDEVANETIRQRVFSIVADAVRYWQKSPIIITSRPFGVEQMRGRGFNHAVIEPFGSEEIKEFIGRWSKALHTQSDGESTTNVAKNHAAILHQAIVEKPAIRRLAANPVMLTCLCVVHWNEGKLPEGRGRVYQAVIRWLIDSRTGLRSDVGYTDRFALEAFVALALAMMVGSKGGKQAVYDFQEGAEAVTSVVARHFQQLSTKQEQERFAKEWLAFECLNSGIVEESSTQQLKFWHLTFQEYLTAQALAWKGDGEDPNEDWWPVIKPFLDNPQWGESMELLPGALFDDGGGRRVDRLLKRVLAWRGTNPDLVTDSRVAGIMGRLLDPMSVYEYPIPQEIDQSYQQVLKRALEIFTLEGARQVPIKTRIAAAEALGQGGDPRLKQLHLIEVPGTGGWRMNKYLVTVAEYERFVEDEEGYKEEVWWDKAGWIKKMDDSWESPEKWDEQLTFPNYPVTGVSWFEAMAYCRWLSEREKKMIRLPTESVWEQAATSSKGKYPWGSAKPTAELANFAQNVGSSTPVGIYPAGDGPYGHCDLAGNVWEWQLNLYNNKNHLDTQYDPVIKVDDASSLRGGSWFNAADVLRSAYRDWYPAEDRDGYVGFRVAAAPASTVED